MKRNVKIGICIFSAIVFLVMILVISNMSRMQCPIVGDTPI